MKKLLISAISLLLTASNFAQNDEVQTLFKKENSFGCYFGFAVKPADINNQSAILTGGEMGFALGHQLNVAIIGMGMASNIKANLLDANGNNLYYEMGYGGLKLEPVLFSNKLVHLTIPMIFGAGRTVLTRKSTVAYLNEWDSNWNYYPEHVDSDFFLIAEPGLNIEVNLYKHMRLDVGAGYRLVNDINMIGTNNSTFEGLSGNIGLKFGWF